MPTGITHERFRKAGYFIIIPTGLFLINNPLFLFSRYFGYTAGRYIVPDWDSMATTKDEGRVVEELGVFGIPLYGISSMYGALFRRFHRSLWTHAPVISTAPRMFLVFIIPVLFLYWIKLLNFPPSPVEIEFYAGFLYGLSESDFIHWLADKLWPDTGKQLQEKGDKRGRKKGSKRRLHVGGQRPKEDYARKDKRGFLSLQETKKLRGNSSVRKSKTATRWSDGNSSGRKSKAFGKTKSRNIDE